MILLARTCKSLLRRAAAADAGDRPRPGGGGRPGRPGGAAAGPGVPAAGRRGPGGRRRGAPAGRPGGRPRGATAGRPGGPRAGRAALLRRALLLLAPGLLPGLPRILPRAAAGTLRLRP